MANVSVISISERNVVLNVVPDQPLVNIVAGFAFGGSSDVTAQNVGAGAGLFKTKVAGVLQFKSLLAGTNTSIATGTDTLTINSSIASLADVLAVGNSAGNIKITNLGAPTLGSDAARLQDIPLSLPPSGTAGGDLVGTYPNPQLADVAGLIAGTYGDAFYYPVFTVDTKGRIVSASQLALPLGGALTGPAGGDLIGTYPNPTVAANAITYAKIQQVTGDRLLGRMGAAGITQEIELGTGLIFSAGKLEIAVPTEISWLINGNPVTAVQSIGTTANFDFPVIVNNFEVARFKTGGLIQFLSTTNDDAQDKFLVQDASGNIYYRNIASLPPDLFAWQFDGSTVVAIKKFGTIDNFDIPFITNNIERARLSTDGTFGIGIDPAATNRLDVLGITAGNIIRLRDSTNITDRFKIDDSGIITMTQPAQQNANTRILTVNSSTGVVEFRDVATIGSGGGGLTDGDKGDITVSGVGTILTIDNTAVTYAKMQNVTAARLLGRYTASVGSTQEITLGAGLTLNSGTGVLDTVINNVTTIKKENFTANGVLTVFTAVAGTIDQLLLVFAGGQQQIEGVNFTLAGNSIDFGTAPPNGSIITITYFEDIIIGASVAFFDADIPVVLSGGKTLGKYVTGQTIPAIGKTAQEVLEDIALEYIFPVFTSFSISGQATTVEVGTTLSGSKTVTWNVDSNSGVVATIDIYNNTTAATLLAATPDDGTQAVTITSVQLNSSGATQSWKGIGNNTSPVGTVNSSNFIVTGRFLSFYGSTAAAPTDSATVRALPSSVFYTGASSVTLATGTTLTRFSFNIISTSTITSVIDTTALGANITTDYVLTGTLNVLDAGGTNRTYNSYLMTIGAPYAVSHNHVITFS